MKNQHQISIMIRRNKKYTYNPHKAPKAKEWLALDEQKRIDLIAAYHKKERIPLENVTVHTSFQATIENQAAMGDKTPTRAAIKRLMRQGADRHEALHAVMNVLAKHFWTGMQTDTYEDGNALNEAYTEEVRNLTLQKYYDDFE